jgi:hypothetical protein
LQKEIRRLRVRVGVEMVDALGVERRGSPLHAVHDIAFAEQELGKIGPVLPGYSRDQRNLVRHQPNAPRW